MPRQLFGITIDDDASISTKAWENEDDNFDYALFMSMDKSNTPKVPVLIARQGETQFMLHSFSKRQDKFIEQQLTPKQLDRMISNRVLIPIKEHIESHLENEIGENNTRINNIHSVSTMAHYQDVAGKWLISCYPIEKPRYEPQTAQSDAVNKQESAVAASSQDYSKARLAAEIDSNIPDRDPKFSSYFARPVIEFELDPREGPCVRCHLAIFSRGFDPIDIVSEESHRHKDIIQLEGGEIHFNDAVNLMGIAEPLRVLTWVEDYIKNPEHNIKQAKPIIRSFLIPLSGYTDTIQHHQTKYVDRERAPGQIQWMGDARDFQLALKPLRGSLQSYFHNPSADNVYAHIDGEVFDVKDLVKATTGIANLSPQNFADKQSNSHQHGRKYFCNNGVKKTHVAFIHNDIAPYIEGQLLFSSLRSARKEGQPASQCPVVEPRR